MYRYEEIAGDIQEQILTKKLPAKEKLPSVRELAKELSCSIGTVIKAYELLKERRLIHQKKHSGFFVSENLLLLKNYDDQSSFLLDSGNPTSELFASLELFSNFEAAGQLYRTVSRNIPMRGNDSLIEYLPKFLAEHSVYTSSKDVYLCLGILHAFTILAEMPFPNGRGTILIEEPTYNYVVEYLRKEKYAVATIPRSKKGLDLARLEERFKTKEIKFFYIVPRNHNPYGNYLTFQQRKKIMMLAKKYDVYIVEDDYMGGYDGLIKYEPLFYHSKFSHCLYLQSFAKTLPMIRIGFIILPTQLRKVFHEAMRANYYTTYYSPSLLSQSILENYLRSSAYEFHRQMFIEKTQKKLRKIERITRHWVQDKFEYYPAKSGFYSTISLDSRISLENLITNLAERKVYVRTNESSFYYPENFDNSFRLSNARLEYEEITTSYQIIYEELQKAVKGLK